MVLTALAAVVMLQTIPFTNVAQGNISQMDEARKVVIRTAEEFQVLWKSHSHAPMPAMDFSKSMVVGVFMGMRPTAGYTIGVHAVRRDKKNIVVEYLEGTIEPGKMYAQVLTSPFHLVAIPKDAAPVEFLRVQK